MTQIERLKTKNKTYKGAIVSSNQNSLNAHQDHRPLTIGTVQKLENDI